MTIKQQIKELLAEGPRSCDELACDLGFGIASIRAAVCLLRAQRPKVIYIHSWVRNTNTAGRFYLRARYALGDKRDASSPGALSNTDYDRRKRARQRVAVSSVFDLGKRVRLRRTKPAATS